MSRPIHRGKPKWCPRKGYKLQCRHCKFKCINPNVRMKEVFIQTPYSSYIGYEPVSGESERICSHKEV